MARRGWVRPIVLAMVVAAGTGAAQLGIGYGLLIIAWTPLVGSATLTDGAWTASLAWATWIAATSVVIGALAGEREERTARRADRRKAAGERAGTSQPSEERTAGDRASATVGNGRGARVAGRLAIALAAALGATATIPLVGVPAGRLRVVDNFAPHLLAGTYTGVGVLVGFLLALLAVFLRAFAANIIASAAWLWLLAIAALVYTEVSSATGPGYGQLAAWQFSHGPVWRSFYVPGALILIAMSLLVGGLAAFPAAFAGANRLGVTLSGAAGPVLVGVAYLLAQPSSDTAPMEQISAYLTTPAMILAGIVGSLLAALVGGRPARQKSRRDLSGRARGTTKPDELSFQPATSLSYQREPLAGHQSETRPKAPEPWIGPQHSADRGSDYGGPDYGKQRGPQQPQHIPPPHGPQQPQHIPPPYGSPAPRSGGWSAQAQPADEPATEQFGSTYHRPLIPPTVATGTASVPGLSRPNLPDLH